ncbi:PIG-L family deacetylase [uncultured Chitinophaga sp.]|uniref:PIG-L family deacetylase n=1 Tax=uncultured Chitinophaga sp. TaxID=339340 RepID=UPI0025D1B1AD|nr:PIG-L family deacetylase [uncultured Chitinophaga sp.]
MVSKRYLPFILLALTAGRLSLKAQSSVPASAADIRLQLGKLNTLGSVLYFAAHPDDENTRLIAYLAKDKLYRTGYLSLTRGDGGQNLIGNEQAELLGLIRTQELLAARRTDGGEQFFTRANDFGFSKNPEETFRIWDKDKVLGDAVWIIRNFQPDVIVCRFPADSRAGHGHHTASAMIAAEAFEAAADPKKYPEQLKYVKTWQVKRLLWNGFGNTGDDSFRQDVGTYNYLLGRGYGEIAAQSRSQHKSQGFGVAATRGSSFENFSTIKGDTPKENLLDGVNTSWSRVEGGAGIGQQLDVIIRAYNLNNPSASVPALLQLRKSIAALPDGYWKKLKLQETDNLVLACAGVWVEAYSASPLVTGGQPFKSSIQLINRSKVPVTLSSISVDGKSTNFGEALEYNNLLTKNSEANVPASIVNTQPYWLEKPHPIGTYQVSNQELVGNPGNVPLAATVTLKVDGQDISITRPFIYKYTDPVKGEVFNPLVIAPPIVATLASPVYIYTKAQAQQIPVKVKSTKADVSGNVRLQLPAGFKAEPASRAFSLKNAGDETEVMFAVSPVKMNGHDVADTLQVEVDYNGKVYTQSMLEIQYDHIPNITLFPQAQARLVSVNLKYNGRKLGYIPGAGDKVAESLRQVGYDVTILGEKEIMSGNLEQYDAIITGVRAYNTQERLRYWQDNLMNYVKNGGTLLVQYNTNGGLVTKNLGPFPFSLSRDRVTDENAVVKFVDAASPLLHYPNEIGKSDFEGWVQERGLYFTTEADANYKKVFSMADPGERELDGSTIVAQYGKGRYVYTSLAFFRELPAGVPGAYRLFVNLISNQKNNSK